MDPLGVLDLPRKQGLTMSSVGLTMANVSAATTAEANESSGPGGKGEGTAESDGDLPAALRRAAAEVIVEKGLGGFSLREVARRAGVSHAAPGYHFGDLRGLLTSLAIEGLEGLHHTLSEAAAGVDDPVDRLRAIGRAYVRIAIDHPGHCVVIWRNDVVDDDHPAHQEAGLAAYGVLRDTVADLAALHNPGLDVDRAAMLAWSAMQGLVELRHKLSWMDGGGQTPTAQPIAQSEGQVIDDLVASFTGLLVAGFSRG
jgi:AcrR family transcriptional regulator